MTELEVLEQIRNIILFFVFFEIIEDSVKIFLHLWRGKK